MLLNALASVLAHPDPRAVVSGQDIDPVTTAVVSSFGSWSTKPFAALVLVAFVSCGIAAQGLTARTMYSIARDGVLPAPASCAGWTGGAARRRDRGHGRARLPGLLLALDSAAIGQPHLRHRGDLPPVPAHRRGRARGPCARRWTPQVQLGAPDCS